MKEKKEMTGLNIKIEASIKAILQKEADELDRELSWVVRKVLTTYCQEKES